MPPTNARLVEVWFNEGDNAGSPVLVQRRLLMRPGISFSSMSERLLRRMEIDLAERPAQFVVSASVLWAALRARTSRLPRIGDRVTVQRQRTRHTPPSELYEHYEIISLEELVGARPGVLQTITVGLKAAAAPDGSVASKGDTP